jgi:hypothetical protein
LPQRRWSYLEGPIDRGFADVERIPIEPLIDTSPAKERRLGDQSPFDDGIECRPDATPVKKRLVPYRKAATAHRVFNVADKPVFFAKELETTRERIRVATTILGRFWN